MNNQENRFRFLDLPSELQEMVIAHAAAAYPVTVKGRNLNPQYPVALLLTCRYFNENFQNTIAASFPSLMEFLLAVERPIPAPNNFWRMQERWLRSYMYHNVPPDVSCDPRKGNGGFIYRHGKRIKQFYTEFGCGSLMKYLELFPNLQALQLRDTHLNFCSIRPHHLAAPVESGTVKTYEPKESSEEIPEEGVRKLMLYYQTGESCWNDAILSFDCEHNECCYDPLNLPLVDILAAHYRSYPMSRIFAGWIKWWSWNTLSRGCTKREFLQWIEDKQIEGVTVSVAWVFQLNCPGTLWSKEREELKIDEDILVVHTRYLLGGDYRAIVTSIKPERAKDYHNDCWQCESIAQGNWEIVPPSCSAGFTAGFHDGKCSTIFPQNAPGKTPHFR